MFSLRFTLKGGEKTFSSQGSTVLAALGHLDTQHFLAFGNGLLSDAAFNLGRATTDLMSKGTYSRSDARTRDDDFVIEMTESDPLQEERTVFQVSSTEEIAVRSGSLGSTIERFEGEHPYNAAIDGMESLLLAIVTAGLPVDSPEMQIAVTTAIGKIADDFGD